MDRKPHTFESLSRAVTQNFVNIPNKLESYKALTPKYSNPHSSISLVNNINSTRRTNSSIKSFFEMLGIEAESPKNYGKIPKIKLDTNKISLADFMGKKKYNFLKNTGFLPPYEEYKRSQGVKGIISKKQVVSQSNIQHNDLIREYAIRSPVAHKSQSIESIFVKPKFQKAPSKFKLKGDIEKVIKGCEELFKESKKSRTELELQFKCPELNLPLNKKKMNVQDIHSIRKIMEII